MPLTRRTFLRTTAAAGFAARGVSAFAATPSTFKHGEFEITVVSDGHLELPTAFLAPTAPPAERDMLLTQSGETGEQYHSPVNITLIRTPRDFVLIDMGSGDRFMPTAGKLWDNLKAAGIDKSKITKVVFTHGHPDHLWGAVDELDDLALPDAAYFVAASEWDFWKSDNATSGLPAERAGFVTGARRNYAAIKDRVTMLKPGDDVVTGIRLIATPGHTQGHVALEVIGRRRPHRCRRRTDPPADFVRPSRLAARRRPCTGAGRRYAQTPSRSTRHRQEPPDRFSSAVSRLRPGRAQGQRLPLRRRKREAPQSLPAVQHKMLGALAGSNYI